MKNGDEELYPGPSGIAGHGLFTCKDLPSGTLMCRLLDHQGELTPAELTVLMGIPEGGSPADPVHATLKYLNHSCRPNAVLANDGTLISLTAIVADSEILINYGLLYHQPGWQMACCCGSPDCRYLIV